MVVRDCDQFLLKRMFTVEENRMFALYFFFIDDCEGNVCIACSLSRGFFFFLIVKPAVLDI